VSYLILSSHRCFHLYAVSFHEDFRQILFTKLYFPHTCITFYLSNFVWFSHRRAQIVHWSQLSRGLKLRSLFHRTLRPCFRMPPRIWMSASICFVLCVPCGRQIPCPTKCIKVSKIHNVIKQRPESIIYEGWRRRRRRNMSYEVLSHEIFYIRLLLTLC
jgi:hypothetical protein